jgi:hypothetical protein
MKESRAYSGESRVVAAPPMRTPEFERVKHELLTDNQLYKTYASKVDDFIQNGIVVEVCLSLIVPHSSKATG